MATAKIDLADARETEAPMTTQSFAPPIGGLNPHRSWQTLRQFLLTSTPLMGGDILALVISLFCADSLLQSIHPGFEPQLAILLLPVILALLGIYAFIGLYPAVGVHPSVELRQTCMGSTMACCLFLAATSFLATHRSDMQLLLLLAWPLCLIAIPLSRAVTRSLCARTSWWCQPAVIFGAGEHGLAVYRSFRSKPALGLKPLGIVDDFDAGASSLDPAQYLGPLSRAGDLARNLGVSWAVLAMPNRSNAELSRIVQIYAADFPNLVILPDWAGLPSLWSRAHDYGGLPGIAVEEQLLRWFPRIAKRICDLLLASVGGIVILPLLAVIALAVRMSSPGPVFFSQERVGFNRSRFHAWKFRTMVTDGDAVLEEHFRRHPELLEQWEQYRKLKRDPRVTRIGRFLRTTSLDELPQIWNVIRGEMSLVGPRPIMSEEIGKYGETFGLYVKVVPGITGLWQVSGRNQTTFAERVRLDAYYVRNWSPWLDIHILASTIRVVLRREGAY